VQLVFLRIAHARDITALRASHNAAALADQRIDDTTALINLISNVVL
jgi:hypothetical protein